MIPLLIQFIADDTDLCKQLMLWLIQQGKIGSEAANDVLLLLKAELNQQIEEMEPTGDLSEFEAVASEAWATGRGE